MGGCLAVGALDGFGPFLAAIFVATIISLVGIWANGRQGISTVQDKLISALNTTVTTQATRISLLESMNKNLESRVEYLEQRNTDLQNELDEIRRVRRRIPRASD